MQETSELYKSIYNSQNYYVETSVVFGDNREGTGKNKFNKKATNVDNGYVYNKYLRDTGAYANPSYVDTWAVSEYIPVQGGTTYTLSGIVTVSTNPSICFYDENKSFLSGDKYNRERIKVETTPLTAKYARISIPLGSIDTLQLEIGSTETSYEAYRDTDVIAKSGFREESLISVKTTKKVFKNNYPEVGCCVCGEIDLQMYEPHIEIPQREQMTIFIRLVSVEDIAYSEWIKKGEFFIDTRSTTRNKDEINVLTIHGYDAMIKAEQDYGDSTLQFPATDINIVQEIAGKLGVSIDQRCLAYIDQAYEIQYPSEYTVRETLGLIGKMYAGNWIINDVGELQLVPLWALPPETNYLTDNLGNRLLFGYDAEYPSEQVKIVI